MDEKQIQTEDSESGIGPAVLLATIPRSLCIALYAYAASVNHKPDTIVAEALRAYLGDDE